MTQRTRRYDPRKHNLQRRTFRYCDGCAQCVTNSIGVKICKIKKSNGLDNMGIHVANDGTALDCPRC